MQSSRGKRLLPCILLSLALMVSMFASPQKVNIVKADDVTKKIVYVVMDTSGSMYYDVGSKQPQKRWCQAKYALQAFALMMDFDKGDQLRIYPMHEVSIGKESGAEHIGNDPWRKIRRNKEYLSVNSRQDVDKIAKIYACSTQNGTPFSTVETANRDLTQAGEANADRWLVVLTDGKFTVFNISTKKTTDDANAKVRQFATDGVNVEYMLFGDENGEELNEGPYHQIIRKSNSDDGDVIIGGVVKACNQVFNRDLLTSKQINGNKIKCDLSWSKLIVFAQDKDIQIGSLDNAKTKESVESDDKPTIKYSLLKRNKLGKFAGIPDTNLNGQIATFKNLKAGNEYEINVGNKTLSQLVDEGKCIVCYEPDVQVKVKFLNSKGKATDLRKELKPDKYSLDIELYDKQTGKKLGKDDIGDIKFQDSKVIVNGKERAKITDAHTDDIVIKGDDQNGEIFLSGTYGKNVKYSLPLTNGSYTFGVNQQLLMHIDKLQSKYSTGALEDGDGLDVKLAMNNRPLNDEEDKVADPISITSDKKIDYKVEKKGKGYYHVKFLYPNGKQSELEKGDHHLTVTAKIGKSQDVEKVTINVFSWMDIIINILIAILILAAIITLYLIYRRKRKQYMETLVGPYTGEDVTLNTNRTFYRYEGEKKSKSCNLKGFEYKPKKVEKGKYKYFEYTPREYEMEIYSDAPHIDGRKNKSAILGASFQLVAASTRGAKSTRGLIKRWKKTNNDEKMLMVKSISPNSNTNSLIKINSTRIEYHNGKDDEDGKKGWYVKNDPLSTYLEKSQIIIQHGTNIKLEGNKVLDYESEEEERLEYTAQLDFKEEEN